MASNSFGSVFRITTFGESHGSCIGVVIDGCPAGLEISKEEIDQFLRKRRPGSIYTSPRKEMDECQILSGVFEGKTTKAPITILIPNMDVDSSAYESIKDIYRPGHSNFSYLEKYGIFDYRGGGRASARETAARVAASCIAAKFLKNYGVKVRAFISQIGPISMQPICTKDFDSLEKAVENSPIFCPDLNSESQMIDFLESLKVSGDSSGAKVSCIAKLPKNLGEPIYGKLEALLASAMMSIPATKGFEVGDGFLAASMLGSQHNDLLYLKENQAIGFKTNHSGGMLGGISTGQDLLFNVAFKPTSSIRIPQATLNLTGSEVHFELPQNSRHDPCVGIRGVSVVEAMTYLVLADLVLMDRLSRV